MVHPRVSSVPVHPPPFWSSNDPTNLYNDSKGIEADGARKRDQTLPIYQGNCLIRAPSQEEAQMNTLIVVNLTQSLGWIISQEKSELKPTQVFSLWAMNTI